MQVEDRVFLVTGGGSGLGAAVARELAAAGARVLILDIEPRAGDAMAAELGTSARFVAGDVTSEDDARRAVEAAVQGLGGLHGLINCAGIAPSEKVVGRDGPHRLELFARTVAVNLVGTFNLTNLAANAMAKAVPQGEDGERGVIVNTASIAAFDGQIAQAAYAASKAGVAGMTLPLARELARFGIRVVTVAPGVFETPMVAALPEQVRDALGRSVPFPPRLGRPAEFARLVRHVIENPMLNGEVIRIDGALRMPPK